MTQLPASFLPEETALYLATFANQANVLRVVTFVLPVLVNLVLTSPVRPLGWTVRSWKLGIVIAIATRHACFSQGSFAKVTCNAPLVIAYTMILTKSALLLILALL